MSKQKAKPMTPAEYVAERGTCCPFCRSTDLEGQEVEIAAGTAHQQVGCLDCGEEWADTYILTGYQS